MAKQIVSAVKKPKASDDQRKLRRNQLIFVGLSLILILSMILSLVRF
jgi:hypothetical protein